MVVQVAVHLVGQTARLAVQPQQVKVMLVVLTFKTTLLPLGVVLVVLVLLHQQVAQGFHHL
tara:strand:- start:347 stop:529 length:183 start_codon:yes stop_codon:yes gene_type:complete